MAKQGDRLRIFAKVLVVSGPIVGGLIYVQGKLGDCAPTEIDGQCGMSTAVSAIGGIGLALALCLLGAVLLKLGSNR